MRVYPTFTVARQALVNLFENTSYVVHTHNWQGISVVDKPEMAMHEVLNVDFQVPLRPEPREYWQSDIKPNLPFADVHFEERVGGKGTNPGEAWKIWPWGNNASKFLEVRGKRFTHTYQERFWPNDLEDEGGSPEGIRYRYADLTDLVTHLVMDPLSRQAYLPIWFPEDGVCPGRKPCTLGYHFIMRHNYLHVTYLIRSCDFYRHFNDDCYLTVRLLLWLLEQLCERDPEWNRVRPGLFSFHCVSLHMFLNDFRALVNASAKAPPSI